MRCRTAPHSAALPRRENETHPSMACASACLAFARCCSRRKAVTGLKKAATLACRGLSSAGMSSLSQKGSVETAFLRSGVVTAGLGATGLRFTVPPAGFCSAGGSAAPFLAGAAAARLGFAPDGAAPPAAHTTASCRTAIGRSHAPGGRAEEARRTAIIANDKEHAPRSLRKQDVRAKIRYVRAAVRCANFTSPWAWARRAGLRKRARPRRERSMSA